MKSLKSLWQRADRRLWVLSILIGFVVTWLVNIVPFINKVERFAVFYLLLYGAFAIHPSKPAPVLASLCLPGQFSAGGPPVWTQVQPVFCTGVPGGGLPSVVNGASQSEQVKRGVA